MGATTTSAVTRALKRIDKLEADLRRVSRSLSRCTAGSDLAGELARQREELAEQIARWKLFVAHAEAAGFKVWSRQDFVPGDFVQYGGVWYEVLRVNRRSLTVPHALHGTGGDVVRRCPGPVDWTWTVGYHSGITGRLSAEEMDRKSRNRGARPDSATPDA